MNKIWIVVILWLLVAGCSAKDDGYKTLNEIGSIESGTSSFSNYSGGATSGGLGIVIAR